MAKKKRKNGKKEQQPQTTGDPTTGAVEAAQFLSVANSLLQHNDGSFDALRSEVNQLRKDNLLQKRKSERDIDELVKSREHLQHHLDLAKTQTTLLQKQVDMLTLEREEYAAKVELERETLRIQNAKEMNEMREELEALQNVGYM